MGVYIYSAAVSDGACKPPRSDRVWGMPFKARLPITTVRQDQLWFAASSLKARPGWSGRVAVGGIKEGSTVYDLDRIDKVPYWVDVDEFPGRPVGFLHKSGRRWVIQPYTIWTPVKVLQPNGTWRHGRTRDVVRFTDGPIGHLDHQTVYDEPAKTAEASG